MNWSDVKPGDVLFMLSKQHHDFEGGYVFLVLSHRPTGLTFLTGLIFLVEALDLETARLWSWREVDEVATQFTVLREQKTLQDGLL